MVISELLTLAFVLYMYLLVLQIYRNDEDSKSNAIKYGKILSMIMFAMSIFYMVTCAVQLLLILKVVAHKISDWCQNRKNGAQNSSQDQEQKIANGQLEMNPVALIQLNESMQDTSGQMNTTQLSVLN